MSKRGSPYIIRSPRIKYGAGPELVEGRESKVDLADIFLTIVRWLHALAAAAWVGGSLFYLIVLIPTLKRVPDVPRALSAALGVEFRTVVVTSIIVLVATGAILAFDRLTEVEPTYAVTLGLKVVLSLWMFALVRDRRRHARVLDALKPKPAPPNTIWGKIMAAVSGYNTLFILGVLTFFLSDLLKVLFEIELRTE